jgi:ribosome-associated translation inhibitor RaiA
VRLASVGVMRIRVSGITPPVTDEQRAYAEYRFFTSIALYETQIRAVDVVVRRDAAAPRQFLCTVAVGLRGDGHVKTQARAAHPTAAIDRAADRAAWLVGRRIGRDFSLKPSAFSS